MKIQQKMDIINSSSMVSRRTTHVNIEHINSIIHRNAIWFNTNITDKNVLTRTTHVIIKKIYSTFYRSITRFNINSIDSMVFIITKKYRSLCRLLEACLNLLTDHYLPSSTWHFRVVLKFLRKKILRYKFHCLTYHHNVWN